MTTPSASSPNLEWFNAFERIEHAFYLGSNPKFKVNFPGGCTHVMCIPLNRKQDVFEITEEKEAYLVLPKGIPIVITDVCRSIMANGDFIKKLTPEQASKEALTNDVFYIPLSLQMFEK